MGPTSTSERTEMKYASTPKKVPAGATESDLDSISKPGGFELFTWPTASHHHRLHLSGPKDERLHSLVLSFFNVPLQFHF